MEHHSPKNLYHIDFIEFIVDAATPKYFFEPISPSNRLKI